MTSINLCPEGDQGPSGLQGSRGKDARQNSDYIFDLNSIVLSELGSDMDFKIGDMNAPARTISAIVPLIQSGAIRTVHLMTGDYTMDLVNISNLSIVNWVSSRVTSLIMMNCRDVTLIDLTCESTRIMDCSNISFKSCRLNSIEVIDSTKLDIRDCVIRSVSTIRYMISLMNVEDVTIQSNMFLTPGINSIILFNGTKRGVIIRDNFISIRVTSVILRTDNANIDGILLVHNTICSGDAITLASGSAEGDMYSNSIHLMSTSNLTHQQKSFNYTCGYRLLGDNIGTVNSGTIVRGLIRGAVEVYDGDDLQIDDLTPSCLVVLGQCIINLPDGINLKDGTIIDISSSSDYLIRSTVPILRDGAMYQSLNVNSGTCARLQYANIPGSWIITIRPKLLNL
uniref:Pectate lyase n=1 Tax=viral metagenome TaxID=1070528 RepID=A0A6C0BMI9_9ZZZZ